MMLDLLTRKFRDGIELWLGFCAHECSEPVLAKSQSECRGNGEVERLFHCPTIWQT